MSLCICGDVSMYKCPRCERPYCSLSCYKAPEHSTCSENFYKQQVEEELRLRSVTDKDTMIQVLQREHAQATHDVSSDEEVDVAELIKDINIKSEDELWTMLTESEQQAFLKSIKSGAITTLLKAKQFWWDKQSVVYKPTRTVRLEDITSKEPSPYLKYFVLQVITTYVHVELIHHHSLDLYPEYWSLFTRLWDYEDVNVYNTAAATCIVYTERANSAGLQQYISVEQVLQNTTTLLRLGHLAAERVCCELVRILSKVNKRSPLPKGDYQKTKKKLQYFASWCLSKHSAALAGVAIAMELYVAQLRSDNRVFATDTGAGRCKGEGEGAGPLVEELET